VRFFAFLDEDDPSKEINYGDDNFKLSKEEETLPKDSLAYCYLVMRRIAYYVSKIYNYEILKMRGDFLVDDNG